jgi:hypothetical protein
LQRLLSLTMKTHFISLELHREEAFDDYHSLNDDLDILNSGCLLPLKLGQNCHLEFDRLFIIG